MDEKFTRRFESFKNSLDSLAEAKERDLSDSFVLSGTSAKFSNTFDPAIVWTRTLIHLECCRILSKYAIKSNCHKATN